VNNSPERPREWTIANSGAGFRAAAETGLRARREKVSCQSAGVNLAGGAQAQEWLRVRLNLGPAQGRPAPGAPRSVRAGMTAARRADGTHEAGGHDGPSGTAGPSQRPRAHGAGRGDLPPPAARCHGSGPQASPVAGEPSTAGSLPGHVAAGGNGAGNPPQGRGPGSLMPGGATRGGAGHVMAHGSRLARPGDGGDGREVPVPAGIRRTQVAGAQVTGRPGCSPGSLPCTEGHPPALDPGPCLAVRPVPRPPGSRAA
jgi:hypothetical protein